MDIKEYRYVWEIARQGGVSRAARALYIAQPSLSAYLKSLESWLGVQLFEQAEGKLRPTAAGRVYLEHARQILAIDGALMEELEGIKTNCRGLVRIGVPVTRSGFILPGLLEALHREHPGVQVQVFEGISKELEEKVYHREVDFILVNRPFKEYELEFRPLFEEETVVAVPKGFAACTQGRAGGAGGYPGIEIGGLEQTPFVLLTAGQRLRQVADGLFLQAGIKPRVVMETHSAVTAYSLACAGFGACFSHDTLCGEKPDGRVRVFSIAPAPILRQFVAAWPKNCPPTGPAQAVLETVVRCMEGSGLPKASW